MAEKTFLQTLMEIEDQLTLQLMERASVPPEDVEEFRSFITKMKARLEEEEETEAIGSSLANCPVCQDSPKAIEKAPNMVGETTFAVVCLICFCRGPRGKTKAEAASRWKALSDGHNPMRLQAEVDLSRCNDAMNEAGWLQDDPTWTSIIDRVRALCTAWLAALDRERLLQSRMDRIKKLVG